MTSHKSSPTGSLGEDLTDHTNAAVRVSVQGVASSGLATEATADRIADAAEATRDRLPANLRNGRLDAADTFTEMEVLEDQPGAGGVLTFTFGAPVDLIWVRAVGGTAVARASVGATPTATRGAYCALDEPVPLTVRTDIVKVYAATGTTVSVWGYRYA